MNQEQFRSLLKANVSDSITMLELLSKSDEIVFPCKRLVCIQSLQYWYGLLQTINLSCLDGDELKRYLDDLVLNNILFETIMKRIHSLRVCPTMLRFVTDFTAGLRKAVHDNYESILMEQPTALANLVTEIANIRYLEFKGMEFSCQCFKDVTDCPCILREQNQCINTARLFKIPLVPEYLLSCKVIENIANTILQYFEPKSLVVLINATNLSELGDHEKDLFLPIIDASKEVAETIAIFGDEYLSKKSGIELLSDLEEIDSFLKEYSCSYRMKVGLAKL